MLVSIHITLEKDKKIDTSGTRDGILQKMVYEENI